MAGLLGTARCSGVVFSPFDASAGTPFPRGAHAALGEGLGFDEVPFDLLMSSVLSSWEAPGFEQLAQRPGLGGPPAPPAPPSGGAAAGGQTAAQVAPPLPPSPAPSGHRLRCIDDTHNNDTCLLCVGPPLSGEEGLFELVGDPGKKNGEKKLRALLARCREWGNDTERMRLADQLEATGAPDSQRQVSCLRGVDTMAALRKADLISLARAWGYRCNQWRRRRACSRATQRLLGDGGGGKQELGGAPSTAVVARKPAARTGASAWSTLEPFDSGYLSSETLSSYVSGRLAPLGRLSVKLLHGEEARAAAITHGWAHITSASVDEVKKTVLRVAGASSRWTHTLSAVAALRTELAQRPPETAWRALAGRESALPIHEMLRQMGAVLDRGVAMIDATRRDARSVAPAAAVWLDELFRARMTAMEMTARAQTLLVNAKFADATTFLDACVAVHEVTTQYFRGAAEAMEHRERWMRALISCGAGSAGSAGGAEEAREAAEAATTFYVSPLHGTD